MDSKPLSAQPANDAGGTFVSKVRVLLLILEGYAYLGLIIAVPAAATAFVAWGVAAHRPFIAIIAVLIGAPLALTTVRMIRTLFFTVPEPEGVLVRPDFGGRLYAEVEAIRRRIAAPRVHRIAITSVYDACAVQNRLPGLFRSRNTLLIGYPLLAILPGTQIRAVIAHELAHIARAHGRFSGWVYRSRASWMRLMDDLVRRRSVPIYAHLLFGFYMRRLYARAADLSREHEVLADRLAAEATTPEDAAEALVAIAAGGRVLDRVFWPRIFDRVGDEADPPSPYSEMQPGIWMALEDRNQLLDELLADSTTARDTHPALRDRLANLAQLAWLPEPAAISAADHFFDVQKAEIAARFDRDWQSAVAHEWRARHERIRHRRERLTQLESLPTLTVEQVFERAGLLHENGDADAALALYRSALGQGYAPAGVAAGRLLLDRDDETGIAVIEDALTRDPALGPEGCDIVAAFLERRGRLAEAHRFRVQRTRHQTNAQLAATEQDTISVVDWFTPCVDATVSVSRLVRRLALEPTVLRAFLVTKQLRYSAGAQTLLALMLKEGDLADLRERLEADGAVPPHVTVAAVGLRDQQLQRALDVVPGAHIYSCERRP